MSDDDCSGDRSAELVLPTRERATDGQLPPSGHLTRWGVLLEGGCLLVAIVLGSCGWYDVQQPLSGIFRLDLLATMFWTLGGLGSTFAVAALLLLIPWKPFRDFLDFVKQFLVPLFAPLSIGQVAIISAAAGIGEEMLFRWCIQGGLQSAFASVWGTIGALVFASILFGLCHAMGMVYVVLASLIGVLLGTIMILSGSVVPSILTHAIYDFVAILILQREGRGKARAACVPDQVPE